MTRGKRFLAPVFGEIKRPLLTQGPCAGARKTMALIGMEYPRSNMIENDLEVKRFSLLEVGK